MPIRVVLVHPITHVRQGLSRLLEEDPGIRVAADHADGLTAVDSVRRQEPDLAVLDGDLGPVSALEICCTMKQQCPEVGILVISAPAERAAITRYVKAGVIGILRKDFPGEELRQAVRSAASGQLYVSPSLAELVPVLAPPPADPTQAPPLSDTVLTGRQREILALLADGRSTRAIAADLAISPKTVDTHRKDLMNRLQIHHIAGLTKYAIRAGLTTLGD
jgi:DNA-binding NarL/FixJ family response regulator